jgi:protein-S-isoprenylcysteine O-methyltransferase Ste14
MILVKARISDMENQNMVDNQNPLDKPFPAWIILTLPLYAGGIFAVLLLPAAGDWRWLEGWLVSITFAINIGISYAIINQKNPRVIRNRMKLKKEGLTEATAQSASSDRWIGIIGGLAFLGFFILAALTHRYGWSAIPLWLELTFLVIANIGLAIMNIAQLQNAFASKLLDINQDQKLIDTGLYSRVRHPLYSGAISWIIGLPIALGSWWALIPAAITAGILVIRIKYEEEMLVAGMEGYIDYQSRVKYKLIPGIY